MSRAKIVIETSTRKKEALSSILQYYQQTLSDWFDEQLESLVEPTRLIEPLRMPGISSAADLADSAQVMRDLAALDWSFTYDDTGYLTHDLHPYPAKFIPQIPAHLIARLSLPGELVLDPFHGSATAAVEALRLRRRFLGIDANPLSEVIGRAKTAHFTDIADRAIGNLQTDVTSFLGKTQREQDSESLAIQYSEYVPSIPNLPHWFPLVAIGELALLRKLIDQLQDSAAQSVARLAFSKIILSASYQDGETRYARRDKDIRAGACLESFLRELEMMRRKLRSTSSIFQYADAQFHTLDSREIPRSILPDNSVDFLVTSPPYPNANDYHLYHRFRLFWLGHDPRVFGRHEIGSHLRHQRENTGFAEFMADMSTCLHRFMAALRPGRYAAFVVGDGIYKGKVYKTDQALAQASRSAGFEVCGLVQRPIHDTRRSFVKPGRRAQREQIVILRKPPRTLRLRVEPPSYRMWDYEAQLLHRELESKPTESLRVVSLDYPISADVDSCIVPELRSLTFSHSVWGEGCHPIRTWQAILENGDRPSGKRKEPKYATHGIHPYKGKFYPQLAKSLISLSAVPVGSTVLDPFCGSGTAILEAFLNGMRGVGCDMHPLAAKIASAKVGILAVQSAQCEQAIIGVLQRVQSTNRTFARDTNQFQPELLGEVLSWFPEPVVYKLNWILSVIRAVESPPVREFLEVVLSSIIRDISQQDPRDLRIRRRQPPIDDAPAIELFVDSLSGQLGRLRDFWRASWYQPAVPVQPRVAAGDSRRMAVFSRLGLRPGDVDLVVTSPPYATALPYIDTDRLSLLVLFGTPSKGRRILEQELTGSREITTQQRKTFEELLVQDPEVAQLPHSVLDVAANIHRLNQGTDAGFRRVNTPALLLRYFSDMREVLTNLSQLLSPDGEAFVVIGDNHTKAGGRTVPIPTTSLLTDIAERCGFACTEKIPISVTTENLRHIRHAIRENTVLRLKPLSTR